MRRSIALVACLALSACAATQAPVPQIEAPRVSCFQVPWDMPGRPIFKGKLNGREVTFFVDTGAEYDGWIKPEIAQELGLPVVGTVPSEGEEDPTGGAPIYRVDTVEFGGQRFSGRKFGDLSSFGGANLPFDAIIGNGMLQAMQAVFDYRGNSLTMTPERLETGQAVTFEYGIPVIQLSLDGRTFPAHLDTGNMAGELTVTADYAKDVRFVGTPVEKAKAMTAAGAITLLEGTVDAPVLFGDQRLPISKVRFPGAFNDAQLGSKGLTGQVVRIDWRTGRVAIGEEAAPVRCPA